MTSAAIYHRYIVIGAGPAGLQLGYYLDRADRDYLLLERGPDAAPFFERFPRHRRLLSINKVYTGHDDPEVNLRWDWNSLLSEDYEPLFKEHSEDYFPQADALVDYFRSFARRHDLAVAYGREVRRIRKEADRFHIATVDGSVYECAVLVVATGLFQPSQPAIPGIELTENYTTVSVDPHDFADQRVLILGKGNSAFETADRMMSSAVSIHLASPNPVRMAWKTHYPGHLRAVNNNILETYRLKSQNVVINGTPRAITRNDDGSYRVAFRYHLAEGETGELEYDRIIVCTGFRFDDAIFDVSCRPEPTADGRLPALTSGWRSTNVPDLYFAGTLTQSRESSEGRKAASAFIHGFRYNARFLQRLLDLEYEGRPLPARRYPREAGTIGRAMTDRANRASCLWQQFGYLCDLVVIDDEIGEARYYEELPVGYAEELADGRHHYLLTLEYGTDQGADPFSSPRIHKDDVARAERSAFLHPVVRGFRGGAPVGSHHVIEDLLTEWRDEKHVAPLREFLAERLSALPV